MNNIFNSISSKRPRSSSFNLSHQRKFSFNPGFLIPTMCQEVLPSDKWNYGTSALVRFQPLLSPLMHMVDVCAYSFFNPSRLTMKRNAFETFITGGVKGDGKDALGNTIEIPYCLMNLKSGSVSSPASINYELFTFSDEGLCLADFLGFQIGPITESDTITMKVNMMPFITYWRIYNEYFRDQNLMPDFVGLYPGIFESSGNITAAIYAAMTTGVPATEMPFFYVQQVCWEKDYFTSSLPTAQRGEPVETPLTGTGSVTYKPTSTIVRNPPTTAGAAIGLSRGAIAVAADGGLFVEDSGGIQLRMENIDDVELASGGFTINDLRLAARLQEFLEKMARGGSRYVEQIKSMFGVTSSDARLQRPEYLCGGKIPVHISEVLQTSETVTTPLAEMAGHAVGAGNLDHFNKFFEEHGLVMSFIFVRPKPAYQQGIPRLFNQRFDKLDWAWPPFANIGEQEVQMGEIMATGEPLKDEITFGYQQRYAEYKYIPNTVHGDFKTNLNFWHWGRIFEFDEVSLSPEFVKCDPSDRVFNVTSAEYTKLYAIVNNKITAQRPLPYYADPTL